MAYFVRFSVSKISKYGTPIADCVFIVRIKLFVNLPEKSPDSEEHVSFFFLLSNYFSSKICGGQPQIYIMALIRLRSSILPHMFSLVHFSLIKLLLNGCQIIGISQKMIDLENTLERKPYKLFLI